MPEKVTRYCPIEGKFFILIERTDCLILVKGESCQAGTVTTVKLPLFPLYLFGALKKLLSRSEILIFNISFS